MSNGLIATVVSLLSILFAFLLGKVGQKEKDSLRDQVAQSEARAESQKVETASARKAAEVVSSISQGNVERELSNSEIAHKLSDAALYEDVDKIYELAGILSDRAAERIKRNTR